MSACVAPGCVGHGWGGWVDALVVYEGVKLS